MTISGETGYNSSNLPEIIPQNTWQLSDTVSYTRGAHNLRFGFSAYPESFRFFSVERTVRQSFVYRHIYEQSGEPCRDRRRLR